MSLADSKGPLVGEAAALSPRGGFWLIAAFAILLGGCDAAEVEVLALPALERPSPEARLGLPEVAGAWQFVGWEVIQGDSTALERTFPSFGELRIETQRLDSIAGTFLVAGSPTPVVGDVTRDGQVGVVTIPNGVPTSFATGEVIGDTLWLELTSLLGPDEWPRGARAAFVRGATMTPLAWLRGFNPAFAPPPPPAPDTLAALDSLGVEPAGPGPTASPPAGRPSSAPGQPPASGAPAGRGAAAGGRGGQTTPPTPAPGARGGTGGNNQPAAGTPRPAPTQPVRPPAAQQPQPPPAPRPDDQDAEPPTPRPTQPPAGQPPPPPDPDEPEQEPAPLLGDPVGG